MRTQSCPTYLRRALPVYAALVWLLLLAACTTPAAIQTETATATAEGQATAGQAAATETSTPAPTERPGIVLFVSTGALPDLQEALMTLSAQAGWQLETLPGVQPADLSADVRAVVFDAVPPNLPELQAAAPQAHFVIADGSDVPAQPKLSVIRLRPEIQAFVAGHLASLYAADWRAAGLLPADGPLGTGLQDAFMNGARYFCGACAPGWPLGMRYPQVGVLPAGSDGAAWQQAAAELFDTNKVNLYFLSAEAARPEVFDYLQGREQIGVPVRVIGVSAPPEALQAQWVATVRYDAASALRALWPAITGGLDGQVVDASIALDDLPSEAGIGRLRLVDELLREIEDGRIYPFQVPPE